MKFGNKIWNASRFVLEKTADLTSPSELTAEDMNILRLLPKFEDTIQEAAEAYSPHIICTYVFELAQACNLLYDKQNILKAPEKEKEMRFALLEASGLTIKTCLYLLGIEVLERI
jgi:arginyl-tRNA synthetase